MRKLILSVSLFVIAVGVRAQSPTITGAGVNPIAGDVYYGRHCDTNHVSPGASGASVTWDLSTMHVYESDTIAFVACASTPYCDSFPGSNLAWNDGFGGFDYYTADANGLAANGYSSGSSDNQYYSNPLSAFLCPLTFGDVKVDSYQSIQPMMPWYSYGNDSFLADAYGTLMLPGATYGGVLRVREILHSHDSDGTGAIQDIVRRERYMWFKQGVRFPLLMMVYDTTGGASYLWDVTYYTRNTVGINDAPTAQESINVYPNPASGDINIAYQSMNEKYVTITLTDMSGRTVLLKADELVKRGANMLSYSMAGIRVGTYLLRIQSGADVTTAKVMVVE